MTTAVQSSQIDFFGTLNQSPSQPTTTTPKIAELAKSLGMPPKKVEKLLTPQKNEPGPLDHIIAKTLGEVLSSEQTPNAPILAPKQTKNLTILFIAVVGVIIIIAARVFGLADSILIGALPTWGLVFAKVFGTKTSEATAQENKALQQAHFQTTHRFHTLKELIQLEQMRRKEKNIQRKQDQETLALRARLVSKHSR